MASPLHGSSSENPNNSNNNSAENNNSNTNHNVTLSSSVSSGNTGSDETKSLLLNGGGSTSPSKTVSSPNFPTNNNNNNNGNSSSSSPATTTSPPTTNNNNNNNSGSPNSSSTTKKPLFNIMVDDSNGMIPVKTLIFHLALFACSCLLIVFALSHIGIWAALLAAFVCMRFGAMRFPALVISALGISNSTDAVAEALKRCDTMAQPNSKKHTYSGKSVNCSGGGVFFACSSMQGWRRSMEDSHSTVLDMKTGNNNSNNNGNTNNNTNDGENNAQKLSGQKTKKQKEKEERENAAINNSSVSSVPDQVNNGNNNSSLNSYFAVFDGHSGSTIAQFCGSMLPQFLTDSDPYKKGRYAEAMRDSYINIDKHLSQHPTFRDDRSGCTAVSVLITNTELYCANAGDSRAVLCRNGKAIPLSIDHKPTLPGEKKRIERAKSIVHNKRVNGILALSRAIGDFSFKRRPFIPWEEQAVTCVPDVVSSPINRDADEFIIVACDGIWDVLSNEAVVTFVRTRLLKGVAPATICETLMDACLSTGPFGLGCDNMSVVLILLKGNHQLKNIVDKEI